MWCERGWRQPEAVRLAVAVARFLASDYAGAVKMYGKEIACCIGGLVCFLAVTLMCLFLVIPTLVTMAVDEALPEWGDLDLEHDHWEYDEPVFQSPEGKFVISHVVKHADAKLSRGMHGKDLGAGIDIMAPKGAPVIALYDGTVDYYLWKDSNGNLASFGAVAFLKQGNFMSVYAHLSGFDTQASRELIDSLGTVQVYSPDVREYQYSIKVKKGDIIGYVGSTGNSTGNHLHFGLFIGSKPVDPLTVKLDQ